MLKLLKNFTKKDWLIVAISLLLIIFQVWLDLKLPDYMSEITKLVQTEGSQMSDVLKLFRQEYIRYISSRKVDAILPKLKYYIDSDGASVIQLSSSWNNGNSSLYFSFEKDEKESSFGMVWNDSLGKNFESRSGNLNLNNINDIIHEIIDFIFKVY